MVKKDKAPRRQGDAGSGFGARARLRIAPDRRPKRPRERERRFKLVYRRRSRPLLSKSFTTMLKCYLPSHNFSVKTVV